jgi:hypothetical protein
MIQPLILAQQYLHGDVNLTMPRIIFWLLLILWALGSFGWRDNPNIVRGAAAVQILLFSILGYYLFGF